MSSLNSDDRNIEILRLANNNNDDNVEKTRTADQGPAASRVQDKDKDDDIKQVLSGIDEDNRSGNLNLIYFLRIKGLQTSVTYLLFLRHFRFGHFKKYLPNLSIILIYFVFNLSIYFDLIQQQWGFLI